MEEDRGLEVGVALLATNALLGAQEGSEGPLAAPERPMDGLLTPLTCSQAIPASRAVPTDSRLEDKCLNGARRVMPSPV